MPDDPTSPLGYVAYNHQGDRSMDFSMVGWNEGNTDIPNTKDIPVIERLWPRQEADSELDKGNDYRSNSKCSLIASRKQLRTLFSESSGRTNWLSCARKRSVQDLAATQDST